MRLPKSIESRLNYLNKNRMSNKNSISGKEFRKALVSRLNTQRRIVNLVLDKRVIIHPGFLKRIGVLEKNEVEKIDFWHGDSENDIKSANINQIESLSVNKDGVIEVEIDKEKTYLWCRNTLGKKEKIKVVDKDKRVQELLSIDHNPAVSIVVQSLFLNDEIPSIIKFTNLLMKEVPNLKPAILKVKSLGEKGTNDAMLKIYNSLDDKLKENIKNEYIKIFKEMKLEINATYYNTSLIDLLSIQYLVDNNREFFKEKKHR